MRQVDRLNMEQCEDTLVNRDSSLRAHGPMRHGACGISHLTFTQQVILIRVSHVNSLRSNLGPTRATLLGVPTPPFTDPSLAIGDTVKAVHIQELRDLVK